jgi:hypothetical protein
MLDQYEIFPFNTDTSACYNFISSLIANGGGDLPEDLVGGLEHGLK